MLLTISSGCTGPTRFLFRPHGVLRSPEPMPPLQPLITGTPLGPQAHLQPGQPLPSTPVGTDSPHHLPWCCRDWSSWGPEAAQALVRWRSKVVEWVSGCHLLTGGGHVTEWGRQSGAVWASTDSRAQKPLQAVAPQSSPALGCFWGPGKRLRRSPLPKCLGLLPGRLHGELNIWWNISLCSPYPHACHPCLFPFSFFTLLFTLEIDILTFS